MTVEEVKEKREILADRIDDLINDFIRETQCQVVSIGLGDVRHAGNLKSLPKVTINITL